MAQVQSKWLTVKQVAAELGVTPASVYLWITQGKLKAKSFSTTAPIEGKRPKKLRRVHSTELDRVRERLGRGLPLLGTR